METAKDFFSQVTITANVVEKNNGAKNSLYRFYDAKGNEIAQDKVSSSEQKLLRNKLRKQLERHCLQILSFYKAKNVENLAKEISDFLAFHKKNYQNSTLSQTTFRSKISNEQDAAILENCLAIVSAFLAAKNDSKKLETAKK
jgi:hypothetical protein